MGLSEAAAFARNFGVMVRVRGPDPKGLKMRRHAFHQYRSGETTLSASGMLIPDTLYDIEVARHLYGDLCEGMGLVVTVASVVEPFLSPQQRENVSQFQGRPELISGVRIDIMTEKASEKSDKGIPWLGAQLLSLVDIPVSAHCLQLLVEASFSSPEPGWDVGWSLASYSNDSEHSKDLLETQGSLASGMLSLMCRSLTRMAILGVSLSLKNCTVSSMNSRGNYLLAIGSPFGVLSPTHFFNSVSVGSIANSYPPSSSDGSLLMADIQSLPGMEGSPVFSEHASLTGILIRPLRQKTSAVEIQLVIPWEVIVIASSGLLKKWPQNTVKELYREGKSQEGGQGSFTKTDNLGSWGSHNGHSKFSSPSSLPIEKAMASVCLVTIDDEVWASGVLLNSQGLILTNAHLLEPWRFGKTQISGYGDNPKEFPFLAEGSVGKGVEDNQQSQTIRSEMTILNPFSAHERGEYILSPNYTRHQIIRVRLDHVKPCVWCIAKVVYVCKGPWDVALLQLESIPDQLAPIVMNFSWPSMGSKAYVIGHGLFGPRCGFFPSVCSGVVAKVVEAKTPQSYFSVQQEHNHGQLPVMLETTAAVHPGASGGAVIDSDGRMIGLITSNARHSGGTVIPHLNFSIPCAALAPIFVFSKDMKDLSLLRVLDEPDEYISSVWALMRPSSLKLPPMFQLPQSLLDDNSKENKGSRFAKFLAERKGLFDRPSQQVQHGVNKVTPSKL
ncbi:glyoxysomal processing protease, glyoxysomal isoform X2 [Prosopis cineraria]|uniref:glyoxysomal processing protease, glyoxysomal isoform X2 n=1 Tax=Prosopis cineraria TaxID=364024 RepID=UPI00240FAD4F|nr:glyoxysomal processing protease, glyoxysomal isoform X2 [Prosopis cineraria]